MIDWLVETTLAVTILMLLVLAVRRPVAHFFGAGWAYALWVLPALRLILPPLHLLGPGMPSLLPRMGAAAPEAGAVTVPLQAHPAFQWEPVLFALWVAGSVIFILWQAYTYLAFMRRLGIGSQVHASLAQDIGVIETDAVDGPLAIGLLDRWIVVPVDFATRYSPEEQRLALQHERIHHQREDIFWNMVALLVLALNWFNPIAYAAFRAFRTDQELSCDAAVAAQASGTERHDYARALVKSASKPGVIAACPLNHAGQLKQRLRMMKMHRQGRLRALGGASSVAVLLLAGISVTETASVAAPEAPPSPAVRVAPVPAAAPAAVVKPARVAAPVARRAPKARKPQVLAAVIPVKAVPAVAPIPAAPQAESVVSPFPPAPSAPPTVRVPGPVHYAFAIRAPIPGREMRIVRTSVRTAHIVDPALKARIEKIIAREIEIGPASEIHRIRINDE
jgi:beta-lactamase regulating signal transducer with metallopeptidase domain